MSTRHPGAFRTANWLLRHRYGPNVFVFRNIESGQVLYTQTPYPQQYNIEEQFKYSSKTNRLPKIRKDLWRPMAVVELPMHEKAVSFYEDLVKLRYMRDYDQKTLANLWRKKDERTGRVWSWAQYRPTYSQEAVADLLSATEASGVSCTIHWEDAWRKGDDSHWTQLPVRHEIMPVAAPEHKFVILRDIATKAYNEALKNRETLLKSEQEAEEAERTAQAQAQAQQTASEHKEDITQSASDSSATEPTRITPVQQALSSYFAQVDAAQEALEKAEKSLEMASKSGNAASKQTARKNVKSKNKALRRAERHLRIQRAAFRKSNA